MLVAFTTSDTTLTGDSDGTPTNQVVVASTEPGRSTQFLTTDSPVGVAEACVRDLDAQTTTLVSRAGGARGGLSPTSVGGPAISGDGRRVAFSTETPLDPVVQANLHIYVRDLDA